MAGWRERLDSTSIVCSVKTSLILPWLLLRVTHIRHGWIHHCCLFPQPRERHCIHIRFLTKNPLCSFWINVALLTADTSLSGCFPAQVPIIPSARGALVIQGTGRRCDDSDVEAVRFCAVFGRETVSFTSSYLYKHLDQKHLKHHR